MCTLRIIRIKVKEALVYFNAQIVLGILDLRKIQMEYYIEYKISITMKITRLEYTKRVRYLSRVNMKIDSAKWYK